MEARQLAGEGLRATELIQRLHLPEAQFLGAAEAPDDRVHEAQRDGVLDR